MYSGVASQAIGERAHLIRSCAHMATSGDYDRTFFILFIALQWYSLGNS